MAASGSARKKLAGPNRWAVGVLVAVVLLGAIPFFLAGPLAPLIVRFIPTSVDEELGAEAWDRSVKLFTFGAAVERTEPAVRETIDAIMARLVPAARDNRFSFRVHVFQSPMVNAFANPGGRIVLTTALIANAESLEQVAGVLAHEMAHVTRRHSMQNAVRTAGLRLIFEGGSNLAGSIAGVAQFGYSRDAEREADRDAVRLMRTALVDTEEVARFLRRLGELERQHGADRIPGWLRTHPVSSERVGALRGELAASRAERYLPLSADFATLLRAVVTRPQEAGGAVRRRQRPILFAE